MNFLPETDTSRAVLSVSELNRSAKDLLEHALPLLWVAGEISNLKRYDSGHWYFSLKDASAQVRCVMFRHKNQYLDWQPKDGMQVEVRALVTLYEARGDFQLSVESIRRAGLGALFEAFEKLKAKLEKEGLFATDRKRALPPFPRQIGIITSHAAAALRDVLTTLQRRMPSLPIIIYPTPVQGEGAAAKIAEAIQIAAKRAECEVLILCRGGGSIEDLWAFNEEIVARAIAACPIPIVSGVGHETDFTIADFVADRRAPTPTGAAQLVCPDSVELLQRVATLHGRLCRVMERGLESRMQRADILARRLIHPGERLKNQRVHVQHLRERLTGAWLRQSESRHWRLREPVQRLRGAANRVTETLTMDLQRLQAHLIHLNPQSVLERGYSITYAADGTVVRDSSQVAVGDAVKLTFAQGWAETRVVDKGE